MGIVSSVRHDNTMPLAGFCLDDDGGSAKLMLVYDYMARGSLEEILHGEKEGKDLFGWPERFKVAAGVARALVYLHGGDGDGRPVIHRDVKSSNILVSEDFQPKLCDFGLALWAAEAASPVTGDDVAGKFGYLAPEYFMHGKVSDKIDRVRLQRRPPRARLREEAGELRRRQGQGEPRHVGEHHHTRRKAH